MIILLGPDGTGKTTLAHKFENLGLSYIHYTKDSEYSDYLKPLSELSLSNTVLDRHAICEYPYAQVMKRAFKFSLKEFHNIILLTLAHNPIIILCTHKPLQSKYEIDQYMPYEQWDRCLALYRVFLNAHHIQYIEYDYDNPFNINAILKLHTSKLHSIEWWTPMWKAGYGFIGSHAPEILLVAERLGPNNLNNLPFETGPTGHMLSDTLALAEIPLGKFAVTNLVKSFRKDTRPPIESDYELLEAELRHLTPRKVIFMGAVARNGSKVTHQLSHEGINIEPSTMKHFGAYNHLGISDMRKLPKVIEDWKKIYAWEETNKE